MPQILSKLPEVGLTIFSKMTNLAHEYQAINLSQGFPDFPPSERLIERVKHYYAGNYNQYAPMPGVWELREQIAWKQEQNYGYAVDADTEITITAGGTQALFTAIAMLIQAQDEVIIFEPAYDSYRPAIELFGGKVVPVQLLAPDFEINWSVVAECITDKTRLILINTPNNPTAKLWKESDLQQLAQLIKDKNIYVISDEVYEHMTYNQLKHTSAWSVDGLRERCLVVASFGKLLHTTGWKMGYVLASAELSTEFRKVHQYNVFSVNTPLQYAIADFLKDPQEYLGLSAFFEQKRDLLVDGLAGSKFNILPCEGTYFLLLDYRQLSDEPEMEFASRIVREYKIATVPVSAFYCGGLNQNLLRLCFAKKEETLLKGIDNLLSIV